MLKQNPCPVYNMHVRKDTFFVCYMYIEVPFKAGLTVQ